MNLKKIIVLNLLAFSLSISAADYEGRKTPCCNFKRSAKSLALALISVFSLGNAESSVDLVVPQKAISVQQLTSTGITCFDAQGQFRGRYPFSLKNKLCVNEGEAYVRGSLERLFDEELSEFSLKETTCGVKRSSDNPRVGQFECIPGARHIKADDFYGNSRKQ